MISYLLAVLAACANATSSVLQRKADRAEPPDENLSLRLIVDLSHRPVWFGGLMAVIAGFLLQAAALRTGALAAVEPVLILELPATLLLAGVVFDRRLHLREWTATAAITVGLAGLLYFLAPAGGSGHRIPGLEWALGITINLAMVAGLVARARLDRSGTRRAALLGVATGVTFGMTAALMKAMTGAIAHGLFAIFATWQTYAMIATGLFGMFLLQSALNAGPLVAAQPGFSGADPVVSVLWGVAVFGERVHTGWPLALSFVSAALAVLGVVGLSTSPLVTSDPGESVEVDRPEPPPGVRCDPAAAT